MATEISERAKRPVSDASSLNSVLEAADGTSVEETVLLGATE